MYMLQEARNLCSLLGRTRKKLCPGSLYLMRGSRANLRRSPHRAAPSYTPRCGRQTRTHKLCPEEISAHTVNIRIRELTECLLAFGLFCINHSHFHFLINHRIFPGHHMRKKWDHFVLVALALIPQGNHSPGQVVYQYKAYFLYKLYCFYYL